MLRLHESVRIKREAMNLNQKEFAALVGVTAGTISNFETGNEVSELVIKCVKHTIAELEAKMSGDELGMYKLRCAVEMACEEPDDNAKLEKLNNLMFAATHYTKYLLDKRKGVIK